MPSPQPCGGANDEVTLSTLPAVQGGREMQRSAAIFLALLGVMLLHGCGPATRVYWTKSNFTQAEFSRDTLECDLLARRSVPFSQPPQRGPYAPTVGNAFTAMSNQVGDAYVALAEARDRQRYYELCMQARGWELIEQRVKR